MRRLAHVLRFGAGLVVALAVGIGGGWLLLRGARQQIEADRQTRTAIVSVMALADVVAHASDGEGARAVVSGWQERRPKGTEARVVRFEGTLLEASTAPGDVGDRSAPRRLARDEKPLFDRGQRLRGAVTNNREGSVPKPEIEIDLLPEGGRTVAAPLEVSERVVGIVQITTPVVPAPGGPGPLRNVLIAVLALAAFAVAARLLGERRWTLAAVSAGILVLALGVFSIGELRALEAAQRSAQVAVAAAAREDAALAAALLVRASLPEAPGLQPAGWDSDVYRRPRGFLDAAGALDAARVAAEVASDRRAAIWTLLAMSLLALAALALLGFGAVGRFAHTLKVNRQAYAYIAPAIVGTLVLVFFPFFYGIVLSFTDSNIYNTNLPLSELWVGFKNYLSIIGDFGIARRGADGSLVFNYLNFYWTFLFTVIWTVTNVTWGVSFGLLLALVLNTKGLALRPIYRVLLILPWAMPNYITSLIWKGMFHRQFGVVNQALALFGKEPISWFDNVFTSYLTALTTNGWLSFPFMMVVSLGALQSIPADLYEAARVDGATRFQQFRAITLPSLKPALVPAVILSVVWTFNMFNVIFLVTAGEPGGSTEILITQAYKYAFQKYQYGYAAAYATIIFAILLVYGSIQNRVTRATEAI
jgi:arabinogalactan oligomer/maltooligosaccharide transport system permease protein